MTTATPKRGLVQRAREGSAALGGAAVFGLGSTVLWVLAFVPAFGIVFLFSMMNDSGSMTDNYLWKGALFGSWGYFWIAPTCVVLGWLAVLMSSLTWFVRWPILAKLCSATAVLCFVIPAAPIVISVGCAAVLFATL